MLYSIELRGRYWGCKYSIQNFNVKKLIGRWGRAQNGDSGAVGKGWGWSGEMGRRRAAALFVDLAGGAFDEGFGEEPGEGGAEFVDEAGDDFGAAGEEGAGGEEGDGFGGHVEAFGGFEAFFADLGAVWEVGVGGAGGDAGDGDGGFAELLMQAARKHQYKSFGGGVGGQPGYGLVGGGAGDIQDIPPGLGKEFGQEETGEGNEGTHIQVHHVEMLGDLVFLKRAAEAVSGVVDEDAYGVIFCAAPIVDAAGRLGLRQIEGEPVGLDGIEGADAGGFLLQQFFRAGYQKNVIAARGEIAGDRFADTFAGAGYESVFHVVLVLDP